MPSINEFNLLKSSKRNKVTPDLDQELKIGLNQDFKPKFVKQYINLAEQIKSSVKQYQGEVKTRKFPAKEHCL